MVIETIIGLDPHFTEKPKKTREELEPAFRAALGIAEGVPFALAYTMLKEDEKGECRIVGFGPMTEKSSEILRKGFVETACIAYLAPMTSADQVLLGKTLDAIKSRQNTR